MNACTVRSGANAIRRAAIVVLVSAGLLVGSSFPSWATFGDTTAVNTTVATASVAPPGNLTAKTSCRSGTMTVTLNWTASTSARVSGYLVRLYLGEAWQDQATLGKAATTWQGSAGTIYSTNYVMTFTVSTLTEYGWTTESPRTVRLVC